MARTVIPTADLKGGGGKTKRGKSQHGRYDINIYKNIKKRAKKKERNHN